MTANEDLLLLVRWMANVLAVEGRDRVRGVASEIKLEVKSTVAQ